MPKKLNKPEIIYKYGPSGNCPVQAEGTINGKSFYFRARGTSAYIEIGEGTVIYCADYKWPEAGWISEDEARGLIEKAAEKFARSQRGKK